VDLKPYTAVAVEIKIEVQVVSDEMKFRDDIGMVCGYAVAVCYKPESPRLDSRLGHWIFKLT
jgi:hypothetical protein